MTRRSRIELEAVISWVLRLGVLTSVAIVGCGVLLWIAAGQTGYAPGVYPTSLPMVSEGVLTFKPIAVIQAGLMVLILTPVLQVAASVAVFFKDRDKAFATLALIVLTLLLTGIFYGTGGH